MPWIIAGGALLGGLIGQDSSRKAANTQVDAAREAVDLQKQMFNKNIELNEPFRQGGLAAQNRLMTLLGMGSGGSGNGMMQPGGGLVGRGGAGGGGGASSAEFGKYARDFGMQDFQQDPGYAFRLSEGLKAIDRQAAARGGLISGAALKATTRYGQDKASDEYMNAFNRYQTNRANQLNPLQSLMGAGQTAANTVGTAGQNYANQAGEAYMGAGNARASGYIGQANALAGAMNQGINAYGYNQMMRPAIPGRNPFGGMFSSGAGSQGFGGGSVQGNSDYQYDL